MMSATKSRFKTAARNAGKVLVAGSVFANAVVLASFPANAGDQGSPACIEYANRSDKNPSGKNFRDEVACEFRQIDRKIEQSKENTRKYKEEAAAAREQSAAAREQSTEARKQYEEAKDINACWTYLIKGVKAGMFTQQDAYDKAGGKDKLRQGDTPCVVAKKLGFGEKASATPPAAPPSSPAP